MLSLQIPESPRSAPEKSWANCATSHVWHTCLHQVCYSSHPPTANRQQYPRNVSPSVTGIHLSHDGNMMQSECCRLFRTQVEKKWPTMLWALNLFYHQLSHLLFFPSLLFYCGCLFCHWSTHNRFDARLYACHECLGDGFILWKCWGLWVEIVGSLTRWLRGTKLQESISPASCCLDTAPHCLPGYFKPSKCIRMKLYVACMLTHPHRQLAVKTPYAGTQRLHYFNFTAASWVSC